MPPDLPSYLCRRTFCTWCQVSVSSANRFCLDRPPPPPRQWQNFRLIGVTYALSPLPLLPLKSRGRERDGGDTMKICGHCFFQRRRGRGGTDLYPSSFYSWELEDPRPSFYVGRTVGGQWAHTDPTFLGKRKREGKGKFAPPPLFSPSHTGECFRFFSVFFFFFFVLT